MGIHYVSMKSKCFSPYVRLSRLGGIGGLSKFVLFCKEEYNAGANNHKKNEN